MAGKINIGDKVKITDKKACVKRFCSILSEQWKISDTHIKVMTAICDLSEKKKYKVVDICHRCKLVWIQATKKQRINLRIDHVSKVQ